VSYKKKINDAANKVYGPYLDQEIVKQRRAADLARDRSSGRTLSREERQALKDAEGRAGARRRRS